MTFRVLAALGLAALLAAPTQAQEKKPGGDPPSAKQLIQDALAASGEDLPKAIGLVEKALLAAPGDRDALFLLGAMSVVRGEEATEKAGRIASFHKAASAFDRLARLFPRPVANEKRFGVRIQVGEARALALEGKPTEAIAMLGKAIASGFDDVEGIESEQDFATIRARPELKALLETAYQAQLADAKKEVAEELGRVVSFPFAFGLKDLDDRPASLADYKGKVTLVDVWGTWCPPCRMEIPHFVELYSRYRDKGLEIVGINCNENGDLDRKKKTIRAFAKETGIAYRCLIDDEKAPTEEKIPDFRGYPTTLCLDRSGKVRFVLAGQAPKAVIEAVILALLAEPEGAGTPKAR